MTVSIAVPLIHFERLRGNLISEKIQLTTGALTDPIPAVIAPTTLMLMQFRKERGRGNPVIKEISRAAGSILVEPNGMVTLNMFDGAESYDLLYDTLIGDFCMGETEATLVPLFTLSLRLKDGTSVPPSVL